MEALDALKLKDEVGEDLLYWKELWDASSNPIKLQRFECTFEGSWIMALRSETKKKNKKTTKAQLKQLSRKNFLKFLTKSLMIGTDRVTADVGGLAHFDMLAQDKRNCDRQREYAVRSDRVKNRTKSSAMDNMDRIYGCQGGSCQEDQ